MFVYVAYKYNNLFIFCFFLFGTSLHLPEHIPFYCVSVDVCVVFWTFVCLLLIDTVRAASGATNNVWRPPAFDRIVKVKWIHSMDLVVQIPNSHTHTNFHGCVLAHPIINDRGNVMRDRKLRANKTQKYPEKKIEENRRHERTIKWQNGYNQMKNWRWYEFYRCLAFSIRLKDTKKSVSLRQILPWGLISSVNIKMQQKLAKIIVDWVGRKGHPGDVTFLGVRQFAMSHYVWIMNNGLKLISWTDALKTNIPCYATLRASRQQRKLFRRQM